MEKIFNLTSTFKALDEDDGGVHICGMASTADFDRAGDTIDAHAWTKGGLNNFEKNPIILFNHNYDKPIGRATGLKVTDNGLELKAKISKSAPDHVAQLVKEGILGAFSVGFRVKDAAELFEVSVVSVPCNQAATFSLAKSFDSMDEYEEFKKTFKNSVDLAGQSLAKDEDSFEASDAPDGTEKSVQKEMNMSEVQTPEIDLEAFAKKVADETAAKIAIRQAEEKAAAEAEAKAAQDAAEAELAKQAEVQSVIKTGIESGAERLLADVEAKLQEKDAKIEEVIAQYKGQLEEKNEEITKIRDSKRVFSDRVDGDVMSKWGKEFMYGHLLGVMTGKGWDTDYSRDLFEKAGAGFSATSTNLSLATDVSAMIEKEIMQELRLAQAFREVTVNSETTLMPLQTDTNKATWGSNAATSGNLENPTGSDGYQPSNVIMKATKLISTTFMNNETDEQMLINLMPMLVESVARAHARAVDNAFINGTSGGNEGFDGLEALGATTFDTSVSAANLTGTAVDAADFLSARKLMGKYGMNPADLVYVVSQKRYYDLIADAAFADITDVGSDVATKITGQVGAIFGTPVIVSDQIEAEADNATVGYAVNIRNFVVPRLRGVNVEQDYEVMNQRRVIVATQNLGFTQLAADTTNDKSVVKLLCVA